MTISAAVRRTKRIDRLRAGIDIVREGRIPVAVEKARLITESFRATEGEPMVMRCSKAFAHLIEHASIRIDPDELIVGNPSSVPWGVELTPLWGTWPVEEIDALEAEGYTLQPDVRRLVPELNDYWEKRALTARMTSLYDDERLWPYAQTGIVLPPFRSKEEGWGAGGLLGAGYGIHHEISQMIGTPRYETVLSKGLQAIADEIVAEIAATRVVSHAAVAKLDHLRASLTAVHAVMRLAERFAELATALADTASDPAVRDQLTEVARICSRVPRGPAQTLREAMQSYWFLFVSMMPSGTLGMGRLDQLFLPWYEADVERGVLADQDVVDLFSCLRLRSMEITVQGGVAHRSKWAGGSKWHNAVIGGQLADGSDATNALSYLILEAAATCPTPHHTITMRVHPGTPDELMDRALDLATSGLGMPAFVSDESMTDYLRDEGVPLAEAWDYNVAGSLSVTLTGRSRLVASPMFVVPRVLGLALVGAELPGSGRRTRPLREHESFESFYADFLVQLRHYVRLQAEFNNVTVHSIGERFPRPLDSVLMDDGICCGEDVLARTLPYDNSNFVNAVGVVNVADSLAAIKALVFDAGTVSADELLDAIGADWQRVGDEEIRALCLAAPKFGNDADFVDELVARVYHDLADEIRRQGTVTGGHAKPSALTIGTSPWPAAAVTGAGPDGRRASDPLAEESLTPMRSSERSGPWAVIASAAKVNQREYQVTELDLRFERAAVSGPGGLDRLADVVRTYFSHGGKHVQFNIADTAELRAACSEPERYPELTVRLGGTTAYFAQLSESMREEVCRRHYFAELPERPASLRRTGGW